MINVDIEEKYYFRGPDAVRPRTDLVIIHHSESGPETTAKDIHQWHLDNGWSGIGYHFVITPNGLFVRGRAEDVMGSHCKGYNQTSLGICLIGDFDIAEPSWIQKEALKQLLCRISEGYKLPLNDTYIRPHCFYNKEKTCPGKFMLPILERILR